MAGVQYAPFSSTVDHGFWQQLTDKKLNEYGLDESSREIYGFFSNDTAPGISPQLMVDYSAFNSDWKPPPRSLPALGLLYNTNTIEKFKEIDKKELLNAVGKQMWEELRDGVLLREPSRLIRFILLTFADLKKYHYYYWFAFPALKFPEKSNYVESPEPLQQKLSKEQLSSLISAYDKYQTSRPSYSPFFLICCNEDNYSVHDLAEIEKFLTSSQKVIFAACDPCSFPGYPGWPVRNLVTLLTYTFAGKLATVTVLSVRDRTHAGKRDFGSSLIFTVEIPKLEDLTLEGVPDCVGWEKNEKQKLVPKLVNLSSSMDPVKLAESAVDLNLKLMRWRLLPDLDLEKISATRGLILGSGTLGCNVARLLMSWGIRHITMVDNSKVSYSNPVRQTLFTFDHCLNGGQPKAEAAAASLKTIFPGMRSEGITLSIPMPGHMVTDSLLQQTKDQVAKLEELIDSHDAIFLLMDTRESRWLPSLIAASKQKIVINAALGFDTFLVLRHGVKNNQGPETRSQLPDTTKAPISGCQLGCYFCNDVVAPGNSTRDRTLDQQCTVTRPGVSMMASALAVELLISVLQHPLGSNAPADASSDDDPWDRDSASSLGIVPHQIRGFLSRFHQILPASQAFEMCTACSHMVIQRYEKDGFDFLLKVFNEPGYLEDLTGLSAMHDATAEHEVWGFSDDDDLNSGPGSLDTMET
ncbi:unnamed protein product [Candidula unifasciata]|uniref:Ubiquitin-like modifier-activating enzyme ATG7 n=1 Tax=Candidula unifasciata TaxID=100452 RepID=A0A8S3ZXH4_9EUPU|nr:unnamed protein product [Candidula unifasciata]